MPYVFIGCKGQGLVYHLSVFFSYSLILFKLQPRLNSSKEHTRPRAEATIAQSRTSTRQFKS